MPKPSPAFEVYAPSIYPERVPLHVMTRLFSAVQRLAAGFDDDEEEIRELTSDEENLFGLLGVKRGSSRYEIASPYPEQAIKNIRAVGSVLDDPETIGEREFILSPVQLLSDIAKSLRSDIIMREPGRGGTPLATIKSGTYANLSDKLLVRGKTTVVGKIERVGGATSRKCGLRVSGRSKMLICNVSSQDVARKLGQKLYEEVTVEGVAQWLKTTWKVIRFSIDTVSQVKSKPLDQFIDELRRAGGDGWDAVDDPEEYLNGVAS